MNNKQVFLLQPGEERVTTFAPQTGQIVLKEQTGIQLLYFKNPQDPEPTPFEPMVPVPAPLNYAGFVLIQQLPDAESDQAQQNLESSQSSATLIHQNPNGTTAEELTISTYRCKARLSIDSNRDGKINAADVGRANWVYGEREHGAVLLINNDRDISDKLPVNGERSEWSELVIEPTGLPSMPPELSMVLELPPQVAECCAIYQDLGNGELRHLLGKNLKDFETPAISTSEPLPADGVRCFIEAHKYPSDLFEGLITLKLSIKFGEELLASDRAVFRVAPWIMTPNTLPPAEVYACETEDNQTFLSDLKTALEEIKVPLKVISPQQNRGDRWIQDEIEFGYVQGATHTIPVVFDSPRDRGLDDFPEISLLGPDFGHFQIGNDEANSLDSFGNLEVSPPVTVKGRHYPFGRIVFGGRKRGDYSEDSRQMMPELRHFLYAQKIQSPFELYTDWLGVGHVDEIVSFVSADNDKGFEVLVASPRSTHALLEKLAASGYGSTVMFEGMKRGSSHSSESAEITIEALLSDEEFWNANQRYQTYMDLNVDILREELGLKHRHIKHIPVIFHPPYPDNRTVAYFPNMINHLVLDNTSIVPKPKGPVIKDKCAFEAAFEDAFPKRKVRFVENWYSYHEQWGEVHCGTNTRRHPFPNSQWWNYKPDGGFDI